MVIFVFATGGIAVSAQTSRPINPNDAVNAARSGPFSEEEQRLGSIEDEMRAKRAIRHAEQSYKQNLQRAREISELGKQLESFFAIHKAFTRDAFKKLERMERLTKQIRKNAGGSDDHSSIEEPPSDLSSALNMVSEISDSLREKVEKTPRQVISTAVIDEANVLLQLFTVVRDLAR